MIRSEKRIQALEREYNIKIDIKLNTISISDDNNALICEIREDRNNVYSAFSVIKAISEKRYIKGFENLLREVLKAYKDFLSTFYCEDCSNCASCNDCKDCKSCNGRKNCENCVNCKHRNNQ